MYILKFADAAITTYNDLEAKAKQALATRSMKGKTKSSEDEGLFKQIEKTIKYLRSNPRHPGLNTHPYDSITNPYDKNAKVFEAYAQNNTPGAYRVFWCYGPAKNELTIIAITPHP
jgi:hypothetical protein